MWWKKKTKEQKEQDLQSKLNQLQEKYKDVIKSYCMVGNHIFIFKGFEIKDNDIRILFYDENTPESMISSTPIWAWEMMWGNSDFKMYRMDWLLFKEKLKHFGLEIQKVEFKY